MKFLEALNLLEQGKAITQNGGLTFIFKQVDSNIDVKETVSKMQSLPDSVKKIFLDRADRKEFSQSILHYGNQYCIVDRYNFIQGWTPQPKDLLSEGWIEWRGEEEYIKQTK